MFHLFVSFAPQDDGYFQLVKQQLKILSRNLGTSFQVFECSDTRHGWEQQMQSSRIVLLLVSAHFLASDDCYAHQQAALELSADAANHRVVPIILRPCDWQNTPMGKLSALPSPSGFHPIADTAKWPTPDAAYQNIAESLRRSLLPWAAGLPTLSAPAAEPTPPRPGAAPAPALWASPEVLASITTLVGPDNFPDAAPPSAPENEVADDALLEGFLQYLIPPVMFVGQEYPCKIGISRNQPSEQPEAEVRPLSVTQIMEVELAEETPGTFTLRRETDKRQLVGAFGEATDWLFYAKPLQEGPFRLLLKVTALLRIRGAEERKVVVLQESVDVTSHCRILFMGANPSDQTQLQVMREVRDIEEGLQMAQLRERFDFEDKLAVRAKDIIGHLLQVRPHIVHFSGHGSGETGLAFETDQGRTQLVPTVPLAEMFRHFQTVQCVLLNACYSEEQARAIVAHVPFVIGMDNAIPDKAAVAFSVAFYKALAAGEHYVKAFELAKIGLSFEYPDAARMPVLFQKNMA